MPHRPPSHKETRMKAIRWASRRQIDRADLLPACLQACSMNLNRQQRPIGRDHSRHLLQYFCISLGQHLLLKLCNAPKLNCHNGVIWHAKFALLAHTLAMLRLNRPRHRRTLASVMEGHRHSSLNYSQLCCHSSSQIIFSPSNSCLEMASNGP